MPEHARGSGTRLREVVFVMLVEPDEDHRAPLVAALERNGIRVSACTSLTEARARISSEEPDVVITELTLPDGTGEELIEWLRADARGATIGVIAMAGRRPRPGATRAWFDVVLAKPVDCGRLGDIVRQLAHVVTVSRGAA